MKVTYKHRKYYIYLAILLGCILSLIVIRVRFIERKDEYYETRYSELDFHLKSTLDNYASFSNYFYEKLVNNEYVLSSMQEAYHGDESTRDDIRDELYDYFIDDYNLMTNYDIRQFHFHFPDTMSFLRMHAPDNYGDLLEDARYSVWYTNEYGEYISGFEEGRVFNGFRYVYPLVYEGENIGSVEISVSMSTVLSTLTEEFSTNDYCMILSREVVEAKVFEDYLDNYSTSYISDDFLFDNESQNCIEQRNLLDESKLETLFGLINNKQLEDLDQYVESNFIVKYDNNSYEIVMIPMYNVEELPVGYFISTSHDVNYKSIYQQYLYTLAITIIVFLIISVLTYYILKNRELLTNLSLTDRLTKIDNRRKFEGDLNREILRSRRNNDPLSLIMFDIDYFKKINDKHGHNVGDVVLESFANIIKQNIRAEDLFARFGGEEFILILTSTNESNAVNKAENLRKLIEGNIFQIVGKVTISCGVYQFRTNDTYEDVIENVDAAMYNAKELGRNKVCTLNASEEKT